MKFADHAEVLQTINRSTFSTNLDAFHGNSGSPVFNQITGDVIGILASGAADDAANDVLITDATYTQYPSTKEITQEEYLGERATSMKAVLQDLNKILTPSVF